jgi:folate-binding protein YgfZ
MDSLAEQLVRARTEGGGFPLPGGGLLRLSGADAFRYLNGQITRDLGPLDDHSSLSACILNPKGKLCAALLISREGDDLLVETDPELREILTTRLERYVVADDVVITVAQGPERMHLFGPLSEQAPWKDLPGRRVTRLGVPGRDVIAEDAPPLPTPTDPRVIETLRIERMIPGARAELAGEILPPEAGLDLTHIDYDRGCYPGQEVISRLKSIGRVNRLLHRLRAEAGSTVTPGHRIVNERGERLGEITSSSTQWDTGAIVALGYLPRTAQQPVFAEDPLTGSRTPLSITATIGS